MDTTILTSGMVNMFNDYHSRRKQLEQKHQQEIDEQERQFGLDPAVANNILRPVYNIARERYFGGIEKRHRAELEKLDKEYITGNPRSSTALTMTSQEVEANDDAASFDYRSGQAGGITNLAKLNVLNDAEMRYADRLKEEFARNNTTQVTAK